MLLAIKVPGWFALAVWLPNPWAASPPRPSAPPPTFDTTGIALDEAPAARPSLAKPALRLVRSTEAA